MSNLTGSITDINGDVAGAGLFRNRILLKPCTKGAIATHVDQAVGIGQHTAIGANRFLNQRAGASVERFTGPTDLIDHVLHDTLPQGL